MSVFLKRRLGTTTGHLDVGCKGVRLGYLVAALQMASLRDHREFLAHFTWPDRFDHHLVCYRCAILRYQPEAWWHAVLVNRQQHTPAADAQPSDFLVLMIVAVFMAMMMMMTMAMAVPMVVAASTQEPRTRSVDAESKRCDRYRLSEVDRHWPKQPAHGLVAY